MNQKRETDWSLKMDVQKQIVFLPTNDLKATTHFYKNLLKLELFIDQGDCVIFKSCENGYIGFCNRPVDIVSGKIILTLIVENVDLVFEKLTSDRNIQVTPPTTNTKYRIYHFFLTDPNGYLVEFQKFLDEVSW
jgi:catechol 2,3-dioxygenase-like lactoylglutathione lyase family enzyme